jgi:hypothetical protein
MKGESLVVLGLRRSGLLYNREGMRIASSPLVSKRPPNAERRHKVQSNHAFGRQWSQSLGLDAWAHTLVCAV